jgi:hypothetical protein
VERDPFSKKSTCLTQLSVMECIKGLTPRVIREEVPDKAVQPLNPTPCT